MGYASTLRLGRIVPLGGMALATAVLLAPVPASATPYRVKLVQQGSNVVAIGSGAIDLTGLEPFGSLTPTPGVDASRPEIGVGSQSSVDIYLGLPGGPTSFGSGSLVQSDSGSGDPAGLVGNVPVFGFPVTVVYVPSGYLPDTMLSGSATWDGATFASLGVTPGTYTWTWGAGADQSFTLDIVKPVGVPEPAELGMFGLGALLIGAFVGLRRRIA